MTSKSKELISVKTTLFNNNPVRLKMSNRILKILFSTVNGGWEIAIHDG